MEFDLSLLVGGLALVVAIIVALRKGGPISEKLVGIQAVLDETREWVVAAEQLYQSGQIEKDERLEYVYQNLRKVFPNLSSEILEGSIEAAVGWVKMFRTRNVVVPGLGWAETEAEPEDEG